MTNEQSFAAQVEELKTTILNLPDEHNSETIEQVASRLESLNYAPSVITPVQDFLRFNREGLLKEVDRILELPDQEACALAPDNTKKCEDLRLQFIKVLIFYYDKLLLLRSGDVEEWDEVDELYVHD